MPHHVRLFGVAALTVMLAACSTPPPPATTATTPPNPWWQRGVIYQIYPRSFQDSNGDGVGDLKGITSRLDYLKDLGVDALWLSPIFPSPMADFGYDVSDYTNIDPRFGTMADFDALVAAAHTRGLRVLLDYVPNHTSNQHPWFVESRKSRDNPKRDWYVWRDPGPRRRAAQQLGRRLRWTGLDARQGDRSVLLPRVSEGTAGSQLAQPGRAEDDVRRDPLLARPRRRRLPRGHDLAAARGRSAAGQSRQSRTFVQTCCRRSRSRGRTPPISRTPTRSFGACDRCSMSFRTACSSPSSSDRSADSSRTTARPATRRSCPSTSSCSTRRGRRRASRI